MPGRAKSGFALSNYTLEIPRRAHPPHLKAKWALAEAAQCALREAFAQFRINVNAFTLSVDPEILHQARIGWRRFKTVLRLLKPVPGIKAAPPWQALQPLLVSMSKMRELEVAMHDTLPPFEVGYSSVNAERKQTWEAMTLALAQAWRIQRMAVKNAIQNPAAMTAIELTDRWIEELTLENAWDASKGRTKTCLRDWARRRVGRLHRSLNKALQQTDTPTHEHHVRILAKRLRYSIELLRPLLVKRYYSTWYQEAIHLQSSLGIGRDLVQARLLLARIDIDQGILEFLRSVVAGQRINLTSESTRETRIKSSFNVALA